MASLVEVASSAAEELGNGEAVLALLVDLHVAMLLTGSLSDSEIFHKAVLALKAFFFSLFVGISSLLLFTVSETTEIRPRRL